MMPGRRPALPDRLPAISRRVLRWMRPLWYALLLFALATQVAGFGYVMRDWRVIQPQFERLGLITDVDDDGSVTLEAAPGLTATLGIAKGSKLVAIEGRPLPPSALGWTIAERLRAVPEDMVRLRLREPRGRIVERTLRRGDDRVRAVHAANPLPRGARLAVRFATTLLGGTVLLVSAILLFRRRAHDPVALLLSFAFLAMLASIDPPLVLWLHLGLERVEDGLAASWWLLLVLALAVFPDGRFEPRWLRWMLVLAPLAAVLLFIDIGGELVLLAMALLYLIVALAAQAVRYRRVGTGIERQQIKWAALGFAGGVAALGVSLLLVNGIDRTAIADPTTRAIFYLAVVVLFSLSFALIPLGLLVALLRFRLWQADKVIRRSIGVAAVTAIVGLIWAASADLVKQLVTWWLGAENQTLATLIGVVIAVGVFAPSQAAVTRWMERRHALRRTQLAKLPARLERWRETESPPEIGMRAIAAIAGELRIGRAALLALTPTGHALVASRGVDGPERLAALPAPAQADGFPLVLPVADDEGEVGLLLLGERLDGAPQDGEDHDAVVAVLPALAEALRTARRRVEHQEGMLRMIGAVEARLAKLEHDDGAQPA